MQFLENLSYMNEFIFCLLINSLRFLAVGIILSSSNLCNNSPVAKTSSRELWFDLFQIENDYSEIQVYD